MGAKLLDNLIFIQGSRCFFCDRHLSQEKASIEHLIPTSKGGTNVDDNRVACCKTINSILGNRSIKEKFDIVLRQKGEFRCPEDRYAETHEATSSPPPAPHYQRILTWLSQQGQARPGKRKTLESSLNSLLKNHPQAIPSEVIKQLQQEKKITIKDDKVIYHL